MRPKSTLAELVIALCGASTFIIAGFGFYQFWWSTQQAHLRAAQEAIAKIYPLDIEYAKYLATAPHLRNSMEHDPQGELWNNLNREQRVQCLTACDMMADIFEYYLLIREDIGHHPRGADTIKGWDGYLNEQCRNSFVFRGYIKATRLTWSPMLLEAVDRATKDLPPGAQDIFEMKRADATTNDRASKSD